MLLNFIRRYSHFFILTYYFVILFLYGFTEKVTVPRYYMYTAIDDYIPFVKEMVIPYLFWYVYITASLVYLGFVSKSDFINLSLFMFAGMTICFAIYLIWPNGQNLRPVITENDFFSSLIRNLYIKDTPTNSAPSMHTLNSIAVHVALINCNKLKVNRFIRSLSFISMVLIIASTVMIKQHSILDALYGGLLSLVLYILIYQLNLVSLFIKKEKRSRLRTSS